MGEPRHTVEPVTRLALAAADRLDTPPGPP